MFSYDVAAFSRPSQLPTKVLTELSSVSIQDIEFHCLGGVRKRSHLRASSPPTSILMMLAETLISDWMTLALPRPARRVVLRVHALAFRSLRIE